MHPKICILILFGAVLTAGCGEKQEKLLIDEDKLVNILAEVHLAEGEMETVNMSDRDTLGKSLYQLIMTHYGVRREDFDQTMIILREDPDRLERVYEKVLDKLSKIQAQYPDKN